LIFDDPAENERGQRPPFGSWDGKLSNAGGRAARAMHEFFFENLRNPAHNRHAGLMRQFCSGQLDSRSRDFIASRLGMLGMRYSSTKGEMLKIEQ
jgi:hypothetical protein